MQELGASGSRAPLRGRRMTARGGTGPAGGCTIRPSFPRWSAMNRPACVTHGACGSGHLARPGVASAHQPPMESAFVSLTSALHPATRSRRSAPGKSCLARGRFGPGGSATPAHPRKHVCVQPLTGTRRWPGPCSIRSERSLTMASGAADRLDVSGWIPAARTSSTPRSSWDAAGVAARAGDSSQDRFGAALSAARARDDAAASRARVDARRDQADAARTASERARDAADTAKARAPPVRRPAPPIPRGRQRPASRLRSCRRPRRGPPNR